MSAGRAIVSLTDGRHLEAWRIAAREADATGAPTSCPACPLRPGGEWEAGLSAALPQLEGETRAALTRWSCHARHRPCGGMRRMLSVDADK